MAAVVPRLGGAQPLLLQSMYIFKQPGIGGEVVWHQNSTYLYTELMSVMGLWVALEDATVENGCMWALPGHLRAGLRQRFRYVDGVLTTEVLDPEPWPAMAKVLSAVPQGSMAVCRTGATAIFRTAPAMPMPCM
ncbi:MAG: phytanoyl-CoA dioxygenase family protein [Alphaproteobacteria bacterium]